MDQTTQSGQSLSPGNWRSRRECAESLLRIEGAFGHRLKGGVLSKAQIDVLGEFFETSSDAEVSAVIDAVVTQWAEYPALTELFRLRRELRDAARRTADGRPSSMDTVARSANAPWWFKRTAELLRTRGMTRERMEETILAEARERNDQWAIEHFSEQLRLAQRMRAA